MHKVLQNIITDIANTYGQQFFAKLTLALYRAIKADYTFIAKISEDKKHAHTLALVSQDKVIDNIDYPLKNTPCQNVFSDKVCLYPANIVDVYPDDKLLVDMKVEGYIGTPLNNAKGDVIGLVVALYSQKIESPDFVLALFQLFSGRISAEMERDEHEQALRTINKRLDDEVKERTYELEQTIESLQQTQEQLIEAEKMSALGNMVAGIAHEVNTPLGVAITAESLLSDVFGNFKVKFETQKLSVTDVNHLIDVFQQTLPMLEHNLDRAKNLIESFKKTAIDQHIMDKELIDLKSYYQKIITTLTPLLKKREVQLEFEAFIENECVTLPGCHAQLLTNLVNNSVQHGFKNNDNNRISIMLVEKEGLYHLDYKDNGIGISVNIIEKIFEPFFTTARSQGNTGLGLAICYNLVVGKLLGSIQCCMSKQGAHFHIRFPSL